MAGSQRLYCDPADVVALTGCDPAKADVAVRLASGSIDAYCTLPIAEPTPPAVEQACILVASTVATASPGGGITSETMGSYSYHLAQVTPAARALILEPAVETMLRPWHPTAYEVRLASHSQPWPIDWWQRNYEELVYGPWPTVTVPVGGDVDLVPQWVNIAAYAGDSTAVRIHAPADLVAGEWLAQVRDDRDGPVAATFVVTIEDEHTALLALTPEDTAGLGAFSGAWDAQVTVGGDVRTLVQGSFTVTADVTRAVAP